jgi:hypothetical protein
VTDAAALAAMRVAHQHLSGPRPDRPEDVVRALGAVQAQDPGQSLWALGLRTAGARLADVERALAEGRIVRTWAMRGTLHHVPAEDAGWMVDLLAARVAARLGPSAWRYHRVDHEVMDRARRTLVAGLAGGRAMTRPDVAAALAAVGIPDDHQQVYFILGYLAQTGLVCPGPPLAGVQTFVLLEEWAPRRRVLAPDEAVALLAGRFFASHGPATVGDLATWSGLSMREARDGLAAVAHDLVRDVVSGQEYWRPASSDPTPDPVAGGGAALLPAYDELLIGYRDRSAAFSRHGEVAISTYNGMFHATMVADGQVVGLWRRTLAARRVRVELRPLPGIDPEPFEAAATALGTFLGRTASVRVTGEAPRSAPAAPASWRRRAAAS